MSFSTAEDEILMFLSFKPLSLGVPSLFDPSRRVGVGSVSKSGSTSHTNTGSLPPTTGSNDSTAPDLDHPSLGGWPPFDDFPTVVPKNLPTGVPTVTSKDLPHGKQRGSFGGPTGRHPCFGFFRGLDYCNRGPLSGKSRHREVGGQVPSVTWRRKTVRLLSTRNGPLSPRFPRRGSTPKSGRVGHGHGHGHVRRPRQYFLRGTGHQYPVGGVFGPSCTSDGVRRHNQVDWRNITLKSFDTRINPK